MALPEFERRQLRSETVRLVALPPQGATSGRGIHLFAVWQLTR
jgi:hypothetical protein